MPRVEVTQRAQSDFDEIVDYLARVAERGVAARYGREIQAAINGLAEFPLSGPPRLGLGLHVRIKIVAPYLIFYETPPRDLVRVLRILHGHRDITPSLVRDIR